MTIEYYYNIIQGTPPWYGLKDGVLSASQISALLTNTGGNSKISEDGKHTDGFNTLVKKILAEIVTDTREEHIETFDMQRGHDFEPPAFDLYLEKYNNDTRKCGFITRDMPAGKIGYSPDGVVGDDGLIEIKCPRINKHIGIIVDNVTPDEYMAQIQAGLFVTQRKWCDFISFYDEEFMFVNRVLPDEKWQESIENAVALFHLELNRKLKSYNEVTEKLSRAGKTYEDLAEIGDNYYG